MVKDPEQLYGVFMTGADDPIATVSELKEFPLLNIPKEREKLRVVRYKWTEELNDRKIDELLKKS